MTTIDPVAMRRLIIEHSKRAGVGHIGSGLSIVEILCAVYGSAISASRVPASDTDLLILSKGHAALALYCALHLSGTFDEATLATYCTDGSALGVHAEHAVPGVDFSTGSLGHGLAVGAGATVAARVRGNDSRAIVIASDAELDEGSTWEAAMFAGQHKLGRLTLVLDMNGQQALGKTRDIINIADPAALLTPLGWNCIDVDGHDVSAIADALRAGDADAPPTAVIAHTVAGRGVSFMEGTIAWHYKSLNDAEYSQAMAELS